MISSHIAESLMTHKWHSQAPVRLRNVNLHQVYAQPFYLISVSSYTEPTNPISKEKSHENFYKSYCQYVFVQIFEPQCLQSHHESCLGGWNLFKQDAEKITLRKLSVWSQRIKAHLSDT